MKRYISATAIVNPLKCDNLTIQVEIEQRDEGPIPYVHVYHDKTRNPNKCSYIRLDKPEYADFHKEYKNKPLTKKLKEQFIQLMQSRWERTLPGQQSYAVTGYEGAVQTWVDTYEGGDYSKFNTVFTTGELIMPDYSRL